MPDSAEQITCRELVELVSDYLEGALAGDALMRFEQHLEACEGCLRYVDQMRTTVASVGRVREADLPPETRAQLLDAFRDWRRDR